MNLDMLRRLAWVGVAAGLCLIASTVLVQPVATSAATVERARVGWEHFGELFARQWDELAPRLAGLPAEPAPADFFGALDARERFGALMPDAAQARAVRIERVEGTSEIRQLTIRVELPTDWHHLTGELRLSRGAPVTVTFDAASRPLLLMITGVGIGLIIIGLVSVATLRPTEAESRP